MVRKNSMLLKGAIGFCLFTTCVLVWHLSSYDQHTVLDKFRTSSAKKPVEVDFGSLLVFPASFEGDAEALALQEFGAKTLLGLTVVKGVKGASDVKSQQRSSYTDHPFNVYNTAKDIRGKLSRCANELTSRFNVMISPPRSHQQDIRPLLEQIVREAESSNNPYLSSFSDLYLEETKKELKEGTFSKHWYRFAGSSVWLKEYGIHFTISRIVFSPAGHRNSPVLSLVYGQAYDENWVEHKKYKMVVPSNDPYSKFGTDFQDSLPTKINEDAQPSDPPQPAEGGSSEGQFAILQFPYFIPIPFHHVLENTDGKYFGPEDAHVSLVVNPAGHEEPVLIYNARHLKYYKNSKYKPEDKDSEEEEFLSSDHRTMFLTYPFQFQLGKANVDGKVLEKHAKQLFNRATELLIQGLPRQNKQKNWVPFINYAERKENGFDKYIYMVYRWAKFEVLKCDLRGYCSFEYRMDVEMGLNAEVGPLRGGTQMINVNQLLLESATRSNLAAVKKLIPEGREVWAGFPRAHIENCGCGSSMYRPNFVVIVKDSVPGEGGHMNEVYKLSHVSTSVGFDFPVVGWDLKDPTNVCNSGNVLISNGISSWNVPTLQERNGKWVVEDYMTLMVSIGDFTVHSVDIKGLLSEILSVDGPPVYSTNGEAKAEVTGYTDDNVACAMNASEDFCEAYQQHFAELFKLHRSEVEDFVKGMQIPKLLSGKDKRSMSS